MKKILENKKLVAGIVAGIVAIAILVLIIVLAGGGDSVNGGSTGSNSSVPGVSDSSTAPNVDPTDTLPDESTGGDETDPTDSTGNTDGTEETDPTDPGTSTDPTEDTEPDVTDPTPTNPNVDDDDNWIPTEDPNATPTEGQTFDFSDVKIEDLTYEEWSTWSWEKQDAFISDYKGGMTEWTVEEHHNFYCMENNDYDCGYEGHWCINDRDHAYAMAKISEGCEHCGKHDCPSLFAHNSWGGWDYDHTLCPEYDIKEDETMYCKKCGLPTPMSAEVGEECCQHAIIADYECAYCGEMIRYDEHHHCKKTH